VYSLPPGKKIQELNPLRSNTAFESFVSTMETLIGTGMGIPKEVLIKKYESNGVMSIEN
jgi:capsid protein